MPIFKRHPEEPQEAGLAAELPAADAAVGAVVRKAGEGETTMYRDGIPVQVPADKVGHFQSLGFLLHAPADLPALESEINELLGQITPALHAFIEAVRKDGTIDPEDEGLLHVLTKTWNLSNQRLQETLNLIYQVYPIRSGRAQ